MFILPTSLQRFSPFVATLIASLWLAIAQCRAQTTETGYGLMRFVRLGDEFERLTMMGPGGSWDGRVLAWTPGGSKMGIVSVGSSFEMVDYRTIALSARSDELLVRTLEGTKATGLIVFDRGRRSLFVAPDLLGDTLTFNKPVEIAVDVTGMLTGDLNNDGRQDLLVFDRNNPGIKILLNRGKGIFTDGPVVAPDNVISAAALTHLNDDNILDLAIVDWVKNELHLLYGVGRARFFHQSTFPLKDEVRDLLFTDVNGDGFTDLALLFLKPPKLQVREGNGLGDFFPRTSIELPFHPIRTLITDVNRDTWRDFLFLSRRPSLTLFLNSGEQSLSESLEYSVAATDVLIADIDGDGLKDLLLSSPQEKGIIALSNGAAKAVLIDSLDFVTGLGPTSPAIADLNRDGFNDVVLLNSQSNALALLFGRGDDGLVGQSTYGLPNSPSSMSIHSITDSTARFVVSHAATRTLTFFSLKFKEHGSVTTTIPDVGELEMLSAVNQSDTLAQFYCYGFPERGRGLSLNYFRQIGVQTFIEQSFRLTIPDALLGATVADLSNDGVVDVAYVYRSEAEGGFELATSLGDSASTFSPKVFSLELSETALQKSFLWAADFTNDGNLDLLIAFPQVARVLKVAVGNGDGTFQAPATILEEVRLSERQQVQVIDLDGDGHLDIVLHDETRGSVGVLHGRGDATFDQWAPLFVAGRDNRFAVGDLNGDGIHDFAMTFKERGFLRVYNGKLIQERARVNASR